MRMADRFTRRYNAVMDGADRRSERLRSFRRRRPDRRVGRDRGRASPAPSPVAPRRLTPPGLAAFEDAPCYRETIEREAANARAAREPGPR